MTARVSAALAALFVVCAGVGFAAGAGVTHLALHFPRLKDRR